MPEMLIRNLVWLVAFVPVYIILFVDYKRQKKYHKEWIAAFDEKTKLWEENLDNQQKIS